MARLHVLVEGDTEERFVDDVLAAYLTSTGYWSVSARQMGPARERSRRGGVPKWGRAKREIVNLLREDRNLILTTMFDYFGMPSAEDARWPGRNSAAAHEFDSKLPTLHAAILDDVAAELGAGFDSRRFVANILLHEFEALLFSDCALFATAIGRPEKEVDLKSIRQRFDTPEHINDIAPPSKRILGLMPSYQKPSQGLLAAQAIGLNKMRAECPNFSNWLDRLAQARRELDYLR